MLTIGARGQIFLVAGVTDMRKAFNTLAAVVRNQLHRDPLTGDLFVFCNRRKDRIKILVFERGGFWLCANQPSSHYTSFDSTGAPWDFLTGMLFSLGRRVGPTCWNASAADWVRDLRRGRNARYRHA